MSDKKTLTLPTDSKERKDFPMYRGLLRYFPAALAGVARTSKLGNDKHNPGEELHHAREKSADHADCVIRHLADVADLIAKWDRGLDGSPSSEAILNEANQMAWRALAFAQELHEKYGGAPLAPGAKIKEDKAINTIGHIVKTVGGVPENPVFTNGLVIGSAIRILQDHAEGANVRKGDIMVVRSISDAARENIEADTADRKDFWFFTSSLEGVTWERL